MSSSTAQTDILQIEAVSNAEVEACRSGNSPGYDALLAEDCVFLPPNSPPKRGDELRRWLSDFLRDFQIEWLAFNHEEISVAGDLGYHFYSYSWRVTPKAGGNPILSSGKGLEILRRQPGGIWQITYNIWNASPAASATS